MRIVPGTSAVRHSGYIMLYAIVRGCIGGASLAKKKKKKKKKIETKQKKKDRKTVRQVCIKFVSCGIKESSCLVLRCFSTKLRELVTRSYHKFLVNVWFFALFLPVLLFAEKPKLKLKVNPHTSHPWRSH